jgi:hypothetical protein
MVTPGSSGNILAFYWLAGGVYSGQRHKLDFFVTTLRLLSLRYMKLSFSRD